MLVFLYGTFIMKSSAQFTLAACLLACLHGMGVKYGTVEVGCWVKNERKR